MSLVDVGPKGFINYSKRPCLMEGGGGRRGKLTLSICSPTHHFSNLLHEAGAGNLLLLLVLPTLPVQTSAQGDDALDGCGPAPQQPSLVNGHTTRVVGQDTTILQTYYSTMVHALSPTHAVYVNPH